MPSDPGKGLGAKKLPTKPEDIGHFAPSFETPESMNTLELFTVDLSTVETNIVPIDVQGDLTAEAVLGRMKEVGVWAVPFGVATSSYRTRLSATRFSW